MYVTHSTVYSNVQYITHITIDLILQTLKSLQVFQVRIPGQGRARVGLRPEAAAQGSLPDQRRSPGRSGRRARLSSGLVHQESGGHGSSTAFANFGLPW
jgi:hypothetical protein